MRSAGAISNRSTATAKDPAPAGDALLEKVKVQVYTIPTDNPEADGTLDWDSTTMVLVHVQAAGTTGIGHTYGDAAIGHFIYHTLAPALIGMDAMDIPRAWDRMVQLIRNSGQTGMAMMAVSAVDAALWDLKGKLLGLPVAKLLGMVRDEVLLYGSGGFTSYDRSRLQKQFSEWAEQGYRMFKMKVGRGPDRDVQRVKEAREAIGREADLFVDANGAYTRKQALQLSERFAEQGVKWHEEPVGSDDLEGLRLLRDRGPAGMAITAGEYGYSLPYFKRMLQAGAVDVLQPDASRCGGITGFLSAAKLAEAFRIPISSHCCPALHLHAACSLKNVIHMEAFHDHMRIESMFFKDVPEVIDGAMRPRLDLPGLGLRVKEKEVRHFLVHSYDG